MPSFRLVFIATTLFAGASGLNACSSEASSPPGGNGGGDLSAEDAVITGSVTQCEGTTPKELPDRSVSACTRDACSDAACIPGDLLEQYASGTDLSLLGPCEGSNDYCVPIDFIATTGDFLMKTCTSIGGAEGRCVSTCIPQVADRIDQLPQETCTAAERCAPCYDPITGNDTQACSQGCDTGPTQPKYTFAVCGNGLGLCVPQNLVPEDLRSAVPVDTCTEAGFVCAPKTKVVDLSAPFPECVPSSPVLQQVNPMDGPNGQKGGCVPAYLVEAVEPPPPEGTVLQDTCAAGELCAPCYNPLVTPQAPTGACPLQ